MSIFFLVTRSMKRNIINNDYKERCFVLVKRNVDVDKLALKAKCTARIIERRQTVCTDDNEENVSFTDSNKENDPTINPILKKTKRPPFHVRGRRKSIHSFVPDEDIVNFDQRKRPPPSSHSMQKSNAAIQKYFPVSFIAMQRFQASVQKRPIPSLIPMHQSQAVVQKRPAPPLIPIQQLENFPLDQPSTSQGLGKQTNNAGTLHMLNVYDSDDSD